MGPHARCVLLRFLGVHSACRCARIEAARVPPVRCAWRSLAADACQASREPGWDSQSPFLSDEERFSFTALGAGADHILLQSPHRTTISEMVRSAVRGKSFWAEGAATRGHIQSIHMNWCHERVSSSAGSEYIASLRWELIEFVQQSVGTQSAASSRSHQRVRSLCSQSFGSVFWHIFVVLFKGNGPVRPMADDSIEPHQGEWRSPSVLRLPVSTPGRLGAPLSSAARTPASGCGAATSRRHNLSHTPEPPRACSGAAALWLTAPPPSAPAQLTTRTPTSFPSIPTPISSFPSTSLRPTSSTMRCVDVLLRLCLGVVWGPRGRLDVRPSEPDRSTGGASPPSRGTTAPEPFEGGVGSGRRGHSPCDGKPKWGLRP